MKYEAFLTYLIIIGNNLESLAMNKNIFSYF